MIYDSANIIDFATHRNAHTAQHNQLTESEKWPRNKIAFSFLVIRTYRAQHLIIMCAEKKEINLRAEWFSFCWPKEKSQTQNNIFRKLVNAAIICIASGRDKWPVQEKQTKRAARLLIH